MQQNPNSKCILCLEKHFISKALCFLIKQYVLIGVQLELTSSVQYV